MRSKRLNRGARHDPPDEKGEIMDTCTDPERDERRENAIGRAYADIIRQAAKHPTDPLRAKAAELAARVIENAS